MTKLVNRAKMTTATTGTGTITLGSAVAGFQSFAAAGVVDGDVVRYVIEDGTAFEIGTGTFGSAGGTLTRTVSESSNADAALNLTGDAVVFVSATAADFSSAPVSLGVGQTWQSLEMERASNTTFQNTTGSPILVVVGVKAFSFETNRLFVAGNSADLINTFLGVGLIDQFILVDFSNNVTAEVAVQAVVPDGFFYKYQGDIRYWRELR